MFNNYKKIAKEAFAKYRALLPILSLVLILGYGFTITHHSIGIDNTAYQDYFINARVVSQGRFSQWFINRIIGVYDYSPFWCNCLGVITLFLSALIWILLLIRVSNNRLSKWSLLIFASVFVSYPIINEIFIFSPFSFPICYTTIGLSLMFFYEYLIQKKIPYAIYSSLLFSFAIGVNESSVSIFLCGVFLIALMNIIFEKDDDKDKRINWLRLLIAALVTTIIAIAIELLISNFAKIIIPHMQGGAGNASQWGAYPLLYSLKRLTIGFIYRYVLAGLWYFPILLFWVATFILIIISVIVSIKRKDLRVILYSFCLFISTISVHIVAAHVLPYRTSSSFGIYIAFIIMLLFALIKKRPAKVLLGVLILLLVINQTRMLNNWFVNDYKRYEADKQIALNVAEKLESDFDTEKPVVFVGSTAMVPDVVKVGVNGKPIIGWATTSYGSQSAQMIEFMRVHGHSFKTASIAENQSGRLFAEDMVCYPIDGYIMDNDSYIIVNFGNNYKWILLEKEQEVQSWFVDFLADTLNQDKEYMKGQLLEAIK